MAFVVINPTTGRRGEIFPEHSRPEIERCCARAVSTQRDCRAMTVAARGKLLRALGRELRQARATLARTAALEMGKPLAQGEAEVEKCATACDVFARHAARWLAREPSKETAASATITFEPLGVVLAIMPWNFPYWQVIRAAVPALAAGNVMLVKHAPNVPGCAAEIERVFQRAGFPRGAYQSIRISTDAVARLIADARVHAVTLTGSTRAGKSVAALAGAAMKPGVFELGGSDAALVCADADLDLAADTCASARLINSGQSCICAKRFIVVRRVAREFEKRFVERMAARRLGDPLASGTDLGPLAREDIRANVAGQVARSLKKGARCVLGGNAPDGPGFFYPATVLTKVTPGMPVHDEEVFGPVAAVISVRDEAEAIRVANVSRFGLGASVFTQTPARARRLAGELEAGTVFINELVRSMPELPFGGVKESGYGRELGEWGARAFTNVKTIVGAA